MTKVYTFLLVFASIVASSVSNILMSEILAAPGILENFCEVSESDSRFLFSATRIEKMLSTAKNI